MEAINPQDFERNQPPPKHQPVLRPNQKQQPKEEEEMERKLKSNTIQMYPCPKKN
jgi:hypothetical protein